MAQTVRRPGSTATPASTTDSRPKDAVGAERVAEEVSRERKFATRFASCGGKQGSGPFSRQTSHRSDWCSSDRSDFAIFRPFVSFDFCQVHGLERAESGLSIVSSTVCNSPMEILVRVRSLCGRRKRFGEPEQYGRNPRKLPWKWLFCGIGCAS
jgi:hypothetical protein